MEQIGTVDARFGTEKMHKQCISGSEAKPRKRSGFPKTDLRYWRETIHKPVYQRAGQEVEAPNWASAFQYRGVRKTLSLGTPNSEAAAARARDIYRHLQANGWESTLAKYRPEMARNKSNLTIGEFLELVMIALAGADRVAASDSRVEIGAQLRVAFEILVSRQHGYPNPLSRLLLAAALGDVLQESFPE
jgi:hypothetical protein